GDAGRYGLLSRRLRIPKADGRTPGYRHTRGAVSDLGPARASLCPPTGRTEARLHRLILRLQRELFVVGAELATGPDRRSRLKAETTLVTAEMVTALEREIDALEAEHPMPTEFAIPRHTRSGAAIHAARATVRP